MTDADGLLMIEPRLPAASEPLIDDLTRAMTIAWRRRTDSQDTYRGFHSCSCGAVSDNRDHYIEGWRTNSLCIHYVAYHRDEISSTELVKICALGHVAPTEVELAPPGFRAIWSRV